MRNTVQIGAGITHGLGAGGDPNIGYQSAEEDREALTNMLSDASMVFIAAGMGEVLVQGLLQLSLKLQKVKVL